MVSSLETGKITFYILFIFLDFVYIVFSSIFEK